MKNAYEIAMRRLERESGPTRTLTDEQKQAIAEIDRRYDARAAEAKLTADSARAAATSQEEFDQAQSALVLQLQRLEEQRERDKEAVWNQ